MKLTQQDVVEGIAEIAIDAWLENRPGWGWEVLRRVIS